ncbi:putative AC transposase [Fusarium oxysporum f. sp. raphani]|nr:putative AC transposase [Fusarium oxysporum f. sp. raphani]
MVPNSTSLTPSPVPTSSPTPTLSPAPVRYHEPPDEFIQDRITYVKRATITKKGFRLGSSHIWKYGLQYIRGSDKKEVYYCHECTAGKNKQELFVINGTSKVRNHLEQKHQIDPHSGIKKHSSTRKSVLDQQKSAAATNTFFWKDSMEKFKELLIRWIVYCHIAFFQLENRYFRELLFFLNPALLNHLPKAAKTIRSWVMDAFLSKKQRLREDLQRSRSRISISFDLWTSPNPYAILGVIAMWIDTTGKRRTTVLGIRRVYGEHTGENLGSVVLELLKEYDIGGDEIGYFMLDNASSNDTAVGFILKELCPWMDSKQRRHRRLRCLGHIVNLCCQAFLMGRNCEKYLAKLEKHYQRGDYAKVEELWKRFGCLGRLHNLVRYIRLTPQRREEFAAIIIGGDLSEFDGLELIQNNSTRWNSWFHSITRALNVRERLEIFSARHVPGKGSQGIANFKLDGQHWFELEKIELALKDFYAATLLSEAYYAAQILDPYRKWAWFRQEWVLHGDEEKRRWFDNAQSAVKHLWETEYKGRHPVEMLPPPARKERVPDPAFDRQREHKRIRTDAPVSTTDLYEQYISTDRLHDDEAGYDDAIAYWLSRYDSQRDLARFALDLFAISPMSDECERLFSSAKLTIVDRRGRLKADIIEACECLRAWYGKPQVEDDSDSEESATGYYVSSWSGLVWTPRPDQTRPFRSLDLPQCAFCTRSVCDCIREKVRREVPRIREAPNMGEGVWATSDYETGEFLGELVGELAPIDYHTDGWAADLSRNDLSPKGDDVAWCQIYTRYMGNWVRKVNHSCEPNCAFVSFNISGRWRLMLQASRQIKRNSWILADYGQDYWTDGRRCLCGSDQCISRLGADVARHPQ